MPRIAQIGADFPVSMWRLALLMARLSGHDKMSDGDSRASPFVRLVSMADKAHNVRATLTDYRAAGEAVWGRFNGGKEGMLWYYHSLIEAVGSPGNEALLIELGRVVAEIEQISTGLA